MNNKFKKLTKAFLLSAGISVASGTAFAGDSETERYVLSSGSKTIAEGDEVSYTSVACDDSDWGKYNTTIANKIGYDKLATLNSNGWYYLEWEEGEYSGYDYSLDDISFYLEGSSTFTNNGSVTIRGDSWYDYSETSDGKDVYRYKDSYALIADSSTFTNNGRLTVAEEVYFAVTNNAKFVNNGYAYIEDIALYGNATATNNAGAKLVAYWIDLLGDSTTFVNYGTISSADSYVDVYGGSPDYNYGQGTFVNYGVVDCRIYASDVTITLVEGSVIKGGLTFDSDDGVNALNVVLTGNASGTTLIESDLYIKSEVPVTFSVSADSSGTAYKMSVYLVDGEVSSDVLSATSGTFTRGSETFNWTLDMDTGLLVALADGVQEITISDSTTNLSDLGSRDMVTFEVSEYSGTISGAGQLYSGELCEFSGSLKDFTGTFFVEAGDSDSNYVNFYVSDGSLGSGTFDIASGAVLALYDYDSELGDITYASSSSSDYKTVESSFTGEGTLFIGDGLSAKFTKSIDVATVEVEDEGTIYGSLTLTNDNAFLDLYSGKLVLDVDNGEKVTFTGSNGIFYLGYYSTLSLSGTLTNGWVTIVSGASATYSGYDEDDSGYLDFSVVKNFLLTDAGVAELVSLQAVLVDTSSGLRFIASSALSGTVSVPKGLESFAKGLIDDIVPKDPGFHDVSSSLDSSGENYDPLFAAILSGNGSAVIANLSPAVYASMISLPTSIFQNDVREVSTRLASKRGSAKSSETQSASTALEFYASAHSLNTKNKDKSDTPLFDLSNVGAKVGAEFSLGNDAFAGVEVGYDSGKAKIHNGGGKIESDNFRALAYATTNLSEMFFLNGGAEVAINSYDIKRQCVYGGISGDTSGWTAGLFVELGAKIPLSDDGKIKAIPYVALEYSYTNVSSFDDHYSWAEAGESDEYSKIDSFGASSLVTKIGAKFVWDLDVASTGISLGIDVSFSHDFLGGDVDIDAVEEAGTEDELRYRVTGTTFAEDVFAIGPFVGVSITENFGVYAGYTFEMSTDSSTGHNAYIGAKLSF